MKNRKSLLIVLAVAMCVCVCVGGTIAYLIDSTQTIKNVFAPSSADGEALKITETSETYKIVPGFTDTKDPKVELDNDIDVFLFVKVTEVNNIAQAASEGTDALKYITWSAANGWTKLEAGQNETFAVALKNNESVYYRKVAAGTTEKSFQFLKDNKVSYPEALTKQQLDAIKTAEGNENTQPELVFQAYTIQQLKSTSTDENGEVTETTFTAMEAWNVLNPAAQGN